MIQGIQHIIFDLGGVIINIDYQATIDAFRQLGISNFDTHFSQALQSDFFEKFEKGEVDEAAFFAYIRNHAKMELSEASIVEAWNAMLLDIPLRRLQLLQQLQLHYNVYLYSNTNSIHEKAFNTQLKEVCGMPNFNVFFDKVFLSHRFGHRKPDREGFQKILDMERLEASTTLFIDDSIQHITAAASLGIQTIHIQPGMSIEADVFKPKY